VMVFLLRFFHHRNGNHYRWFFKPTSLCILFLNTSYAATSMNRNFFFILLLSLTGPSWSPHDHITTMSLLQKTFSASPFLPPSNFRLKNRIACIQDNLFFCYIILFVSTTASFLTSSSMAHISPIFSVLFFMFGKCIQTTIAFNCYLVNFSLSLSSPPSLSNSLLFDEKNREKRATEEIRLASESSGYHFQTNAASFDDDDPSLLSMINTFAYVLFADLLGFSDTRFLST
jgi:hypothetical protein